MNQLITKVRALFGDVALMSDVDDLADLYERHFGSREWWTAETKWFDPGRTSAETGGIFTNEINRQSSQYRDAHMARLLGEAIREGERVMAVVGRNHVPSQKERSNATRGLSESGARDRPGLLGSAHRAPAPRRGLVFGRAQEEARRAIEGRGLHVPLLDEQTISDYFLNTPLEVVRLPLDPS